MIDPQGLRHPSLPHATSQLTLTGTSSEKEKLKLDSYHTLSERAGAVAGTGT